jgi:hypothetical protein
MKRRKTSRNRRLEPQYAPTYTENGSFLMIPKVRIVTATPGTLTADDLFNSLGIPASSISGFKCSGITFSLAQGATASIAQGSLAFGSGKTHVLTDSLKAAKVKPSPYSVEGLWISRELTSLQLQAITIATWNVTNVTLDYVGISVRFRSL